MIFAVLYIHYTESNSKTPSLNRNKNKDRKNVGEGPCHHGLPKIHIPLGWMELRGAESQGAAARSGPTSLDTPLTDRPSRSLGGRAHPPRKGVIQSPHTTAIK